MTLSYALSQGPESQTGAFRMSEVPMPAERVIMICLAIAVAAALIYFLLSLAGAV